MAAQTVRRGVDSILVSQLAQQAEQHAAGAGDELARRVASTLPWSTLPGSAAFKISSAVSILPSRARVRPSI